jgi:DNA-binding IclR family transcriptional regulator
MSVSDPDGSRTAPADAPARKGIQSVETGFRVLQALMLAGRPVPLRAIARQTGLSPSKVHFYLVSLTACGLVRQDSDDGHYGLGPGALHLGMAYLEQFDLFTAAKPQMVELVEAFDYTVFLGVWGTRGPTIIYRVNAQSSSAVFELRVGSVLPLLRSALGRNFLAHLPASTVAPLVEQELAAVAPPRAAAAADPEMPRTLDEVEALAGTVRRHGLGRSRGSLLSDFTALSAPVFDHSGTLLAGITVMGPSSEMDDAYDGPVAEAVRAATERVSEAAGWRPPQRA